MELKEIEIEGRKYKAYVSPDAQEGAFVIVGPPEGLVDELGLPEPFATRLHNILYDRGIFSYNDAAKKNAIIGALQEVLNVDAQLIVEKFHKFETETVV
jgi:hypothetical protein